MPSLWEICKVGDELLRRVYVDISSSAAKNKEIARRFRSVDSAFRSGTRLFETNVKVAELMLGSSDGTLPLGMLSSIIIGELGDATFGQNVFVHADFDKVQFASRATKTLVEEKLKILKKI